jgi:putative transposase
MQDDPGRAILTKRSGKAICASLPHPKKKADGWMARFARVIALGVPHHITQRGNARRFILENDAERRVYLDLLRQSVELHEIELMGYCLMSNHVHLVAIPNKANVLGLALKEAHGRYASYWNAMHSSSGHVWQGRYYSCPLDESHLWETLRYTELNPVRASMVANAESWGWSSAAAHCSTAAPDSWLGMRLWRGRWSATNWREYLEAGESQATLAAIRHNTHTGRPLGSPDFMRAVEGQTKRRLASQKRGPKREAEPGKSQGTFSFGG